MDRIRQQLNLANVTLGTASSVVKLDSGTTIAHLVNQLGLSNESVAQLIAMLNMGDRPTPTCCNC